MFIVYILKEDKPYDLLPLNILVINVLRWGYEAIKLL